MMPHATYRRITFNSLTLIVVLLAFIFISLVNAAPIINSPRFEQLSTENGLSQDSVNDMLVDSNGFLWVATETGLNRFDGYRNKQYKGLDNEFADDGIYSLFEDQQQNLWVSTYSSGIYKIDRQTGKSARVLAVPYQNDPQWYQYASHYIAGSSNTIYIALDHLVVRYNIETNDSSTVFDIFSPTLELSEDVVVRFLALHDEILFIATSAGLYTLDTATNTVRHIKYTQKSLANNDKLNAKFIKIDANQNFWLGAVEGLYRFNLNQLVAFARGKDTQPAVDNVLGMLNIWGMLQIDGDLHYLATNDGLYTIDLATLQLQHLFRASDSNLLITDDDITKLERTPNGQLWMSTKASGMLLWDPRSVLFKNVYVEKGAGSQLSDNTVHDLHAQDDSNLWVATNNGLNLYNLDSGDIEQFLVSSDKKAVASSGSILIIREGEGNWVWLVTYEAILKFDLVEKRVLPLNLDTITDELFNSDTSYDILRLSADKYIVAGEAGFSQLDLKKKTLSTDEALTSTLDTNQFYTFLPDYASQENTVLISMTGALWRYNATTGVLEKIHEARSLQSEYVIQPTEAILDDYGVLWISYPGHGLYGLDSTSYAQKYFFDTSTLLPTNIIFSLEKDKHGYIWMGSHKGLLQFNPKTLSFKQYTTKEGLVTNEFKWGSKKPLNNGDLVYGSQKGFTLFNPSKLAQNDSRLPNVMITDVNLISSQLEIGAGDKSNKAIELEYNDIGLTINYSDMQYDQTNLGIYKYTLQGDVDVSFPPTHLTEVTFPQLEPGNYIFSVSRFDVANEISGPASTLRINVKYPYFASPFAYFVYGTMLAIAVALLAWRRKLHGDKLRAAHLNVLKNKNRLSMALTASNTRVWQWHENSNCITQERMAKDLGYEVADNALDFDTHCELIHDHDRNAFESQWRRVLSGERKNIDITYRLKAKDGSYEWFRDVGSLVDTTELNASRQLAGTYSNVTESINTQTKAQLFGEAFEHTRDWVVIFDDKFRPIVANQSFKEALCLCPEKEIAEQLDTIFSNQKNALLAALAKMRRLAPNEHWSGETEIQSLRGDNYAVNIGITAVSNAQDRNEISRYLVILSDITQQKHAQGALVQLANYDSLTGLPNRSLLLDRVQHAFDQATRDNTSIGLFFIDLDRFKQINDSLGHDAGDMLLRVIGERLEQLLRQADTVARLGGDEFVVMIENIADDKDLSHLASDMIRELSKSITLDNQVVSVSASIGISFYPEDASTPAELLKNADIAMYHAKELGSNNFQYFTAYMNERAQQKLKLENAIKQAYSNNAFTSYFQPIVHCHDGSISGFEMLMRWPTENGMTPPDTFIPIAEDIGLIEDMTTQVIAKAIPFLSTPEWQESGYYLSINLSATHISKAAKIDEIVELLKTHNIPTSAIRFEITESALMSDYESAMGAIAKMKDNGFVIALDDFGTGYSSLKYLKDFPIDILKIDKSFVQDIGFDGGNEPIVLATLRMAESLNIQCVAEGIETQQQADFFKQNGCTYLQGYLYAKPLPESDMLSLLNKEVTRIPT